MRSVLPLLFSGLLIFSAQARLRTNASIRLENVITRAGADNKVHLNKNDLELVLFSDMARDSRSSIKLYDDFENRSVGFWYSAYPAAYASGRLVQTDFKIELNVPEDGVFKADGFSGSSGGGFSVRRNIRTEKDAACGIFKLANGRYLLPVLYAKLPCLEENRRFANLKRSRVEFKIIAIRSRDLQKITGCKDLNAFLVQEDATLLGEKAPAAAQCVFFARNGHARFEQMDPAPVPGVVRGNKTGLQIELSEDAGAIRISAAYSRIAGKRSNGKLIAEYFELDGVTSVRDGLWHIPVRLRPFRSGNQASFEEKRDIQNPVERIIMIRITEIKR